MANYEAAIDCVTGKAFIYEWEYVGKSPKGTKVNWKAVGLKEGDVSEPIKAFGKTHKFAHSKAEAIDAAEASVMAFEGNWAMAASLKNIRKAARKIVAFEILRAMVRLESPRRPSKLPHEQKDPAGVKE